MPLPVGVTHVLAERASLVIQAWTYAVAPAATIDPTTLLVMALARDGIATGGAEGQLDAATGDTMGTPTNDRPTTTEDGNPKENARLTSAIKRTCRGSTGRTQFAPVTSFSGTL